VIQDRVGGFAGSFTGKRKKPPGGGFSFIARAGKRAA